VVLAAFDGPLWEGPFHAAGPVRAVAELAVAGRDAEIGLSVDAGLRRRGLGVHLVQTAARVLAPRGVERLLAYTLPRNRAMLSLAQSSGAPSSAARTTW
jgi:GNAT superfamily N-acetyltransferase